MSGTRCRVAICDDQASFRELVALVLGLDPELCVVGEASDGRRAIELATALQPDVLLLDIAMPVMDGLEALPLIRDAAAATKIVMLTGVATPRVREQAMAGGAAGFIEKGADVADLARQIKDICRVAG
jgi:DNA-binding NarL/FixJ family response regulator